MLKIRLYLIVLERLSFLSNECVSCKPSRLILVFEAARSREDWMRFCWLLWAWFGKNLFPCNRLLGKDYHPSVCEPDYSLNNGLCKIVPFIKKLKNEPHFGGFMLWDAYWDQQNVINGKMYSDHIADILNTGRYILPPIPEDLDTVTATRGGGGETRQGTSRTSGDSATGVPITATSATRGGREGVGGNVDFFLKPSFFFLFSLIEVE